MPKRIRTVTKKAAELRSSAFEISTESGTLVYLQYPCSSPNLPIAAKRYRIKIGITLNKPCRFRKWNSKRRAQAVTAAVDTRNAWSARIKKLRIFKDVDI